MGLELLQEVRVEAMLGGGVVAKLIQRPWKDRVSSRMLCQDWKTTDTSGQPQRTVTISETVGQDCPIHRVPPTITVCLRL